MLIMELIGVFKSWESVLKYIDFSLQRLAALSLSFKEVTSLMITIAVVNTDALPIRVTAIVIILLF